MKNFFPLPVCNAIIFTKQHAVSALPALAVLMLILLSGCSTTKQEAPAQTASINIEERLKNAIVVKQTLLKQLDHPKSVNETIQIKEELDKLQLEIETLKAGKKAAAIQDDDGFKSVKQKRVYYGPIGAVVEMTKWILEKLHIIYET